MSVQQSHTSLLGRRDFNRVCAAAGLSLSALGTMAAVPYSPAFAAAGEEKKPQRRTVELRDGTRVPAIGQGSWHLAQGRHPSGLEEEALRTGISLGLTMIDTAE